MLLLSAKWLVSSVAVYVVVLAAVTIPFLQTHLVFGHHPGFFATPTDFTRPEVFGIAPGKAINLNLGTPPTQLGAWFIASDSYHRTLPFPPVDNTTLDVRAALELRPTILFLHGKDGHRARHFRVLLCSALTSRLDVNVLALDYRGFGDSTGTPSLAGVAEDARTAFDWLLWQGAVPRDVLILGTSLGTNFAALLAASLGAEGIRPRGMVLLSPFASMRRVMYETKLFGFVPLLWPVAGMPFVTRLIDSFIAHPFNTVGLVPQLDLPILIAHAEDDPIVSHTHADELWDTFLSSTSKPSVAVQEIPYWGTISTLQRKGEEMVLIKTHQGGHGVGSLEGVQDAIGRMFGLV
ncbi:Alpha/Beta hydrolase protein [Roridomyces roridus]|uniref:Alpha/Beta hydrolase protein n=1 Tax=Roridomyces roridus TaxID=1738132 RepID=A0AAD7BGB0_9AGAR|nr:Alpha/Beta hydrolase protein [Roridomyces roridus]